MSDAITLKSMCTKTSTATHWKKLYSAALVESDRTKMLPLIVHAESAIVLRARVLFDSRTDNFEEKQALDSALSTLHLLKNCLTMRAHAISLWPETHSGCATKRVVP
jgi:hypothetical protein